MADKQTKLSIVIATVDKATAKLKAISDRLDKITKPVRDFREALSGLREKSGLDDVIGGFRGVGGALADLLGKVALVGGVVGGAVAGLMHLVNEFDDLGDKAERFGVSVDFLAQMRFAAEHAGASVEELDGGLKAFSQSLGQARAGTGRMAAFLGKVSPALLRQVKAAKSNEQAFDLMANAMAKIQDPAKRAALAQKVFGDAALAPLLGKGAKGVKELRDRFLDLAGPQAGAAEEAGKVDESMHDLKAAMQGVKAALVQGLAPALKIVIDRLREFFNENRARIAEWAANLGKKLPGAIAKLIEFFHSVVDAVRPFVDSATKLKIIGLAVAAVIVGPLVSSVYALGVALLTTPVGWIVGGIAAIAAGAILLIRNWDSVAAFFVDLWDVVKEKFGEVVAFIMPLIKPFVLAAGVIVDNWGPIKDFFVALWDDIIQVFQSAWEVISGIVDKVAGAVTWVTDKVGWIADKVGIGGFGIGGVAADTVKGMQGPSVADLVMQSMRAQSSQAKVTVDFSNAPRGTRVKTDPQSTADIDMTVGYQMIIGGM
jgi:phage-related minor tail protein